MPRRMQLALLATTLALAAPAGAQAEPYQHVTQPVATGSGGAAATVDSVATKAATDALRAGGNAVDAAVAAAAVLGVTEPFSSGIGGGGFMVIRTPDGEVTTIDGREEAPAAMTPTSFVDPATGQPYTFAEARYSGLSAGVPGTVATWDLALDEYGTWPLERVLQRGIDVAREGFVIDKTFFDQVARQRRGVRRHHIVRRPLPRRRREPARRRHGAAQHRHGQGLRAHRQARREGLLPRCDR